MKKKRQAAEADIVMSGVDTKVLMASYIEDNTSQGKRWIFDFRSTAHVFSHKDMFNSLLANEEGNVKMVDGSTARSSILGQPQEEM